MGIPRPLRRSSSTRPGFDSPGTFADSLAPYAGRFGLRKGDGLGLLRWMLGIVGDPDTPRWVEEARAHIERRAARANAGMG
jgi:hypothetical protein